MQEIVTVTGPALCVVRVRIGCVEAGLKNKRKNGEESDKRGGAAVTARTGAREGMLLIQDNPKGRALTTPKNWHQQNTRWCLDLLTCCRRQKAAVKGRSLGGKKPLGRQ